MEEIYNSFSKNIQDSCQSPAKVPKEIEDLQHDFELIKHKTNNVKSCALYCCTNCGCNMVLFMVRGRVSMIDMNIKKSKKHLYAMPRTKEELNDVIATMVNCHEYVIEDILT